jgi:hypothetical protein
MEIAVQLHDLAFAGFLVQTIKQTNVSALLDTLIGYGSHMVADLVGFHPSSGYLSSGYTTKYGPLNWAIMQPRMQSIDCYLFNKLQLKVDLLPNNTLNSDAVQFIADGTSSYAQSNPGFPSYNQSVITDCTGSWISIVKRLYSYYKGANPPASYEASMIYFDESNSKSFEETVLYFEKNAICAANAISFWWKEIQTAGVSYVEAATQTAKFIDDSYNSGLCTSAEQNSGVRRISIEIIFVLIPTIYVTIN